MNCEFSPLVSIIIPVFNGANYMREAIDSALAQTYKNIEVIVVNDGSNDDGETEMIALSYGDRIKYFKKENGGVSSALNFGIRKMHGEYFSWLSHDDKYAPEKIESQIQSISQYPDKNIVSLCGSRQINEHSEFISEMKRPFKPHVLISSEDVLYSLLGKGCFDGCALLIPKKAFDVTGNFHEDLRFSQDYLKWIQIFLKGYSLVYNDDPYAYGRVHNKQLTQTGQELYHKDSDVICEIVLEDVSEKSTVDKNFLYAFALYNAKYNNASSTRKCIVAAREKRCITLHQYIAISGMYVYGIVRPYIRKIYYECFKKLNRK